MIAKTQKFIATSLTALALVGLSASAGAAGSGSDYAFDQMIGSMAARDTGSAWFDGYVETVNQQIAYLSRAEPYGAAGPNGPADGFNGYVAGFTAADSGSMWFNDYVDAVNRVIRSKQEF
jgi:hypothetical protein